MSFKNFGFQKEILRAIDEKGYTEATPIQTQAIPLILSGNDLLAGAQTGTGKTAGFTLPLLQLLMNKNQKKFKIRALILAPTRELAAQIADNVKIYGKYLPLRAQVVFGGVNMGMQIKKVRSGTDILIATPGRLLDLVSQKVIDLSHVEILVIDEADRMMDMGFIPDIRKILTLLPGTRQSLLFSATFSKEIKNLAYGLLKSPQTIEAVADHTTAELVSQVVYPVDNKLKRELLTHLISSQKWEQVLVFTRTKHGANRLSEQLATDGITANAIHGNKTQAARTKVLHDFKKGAFRVLVATDIAARGLDIDQLPHVVNFELPDVPEDYVHRIGRTGRAGNTGCAYSLVSNNERRLLAGIERLLKRKIPQVVEVGYEQKTSTSSTAEPNQMNRRRGGQARSPNRDFHTGRPRSHSPKQTTSNQPHQKTAHQSQQKTINSSHQKPANPSHQKPANSRYNKPQKPYFARKQKSWK